MFTDSCGAEVAATVSDVHQFSAPIAGIEKQAVAIAFELAFRGEQKSFDPKKPIADQLRIIPSERGMVSVFFPADKEVSGLRYHLHAPFVPELSRASIKNTPENTPLFEQLARLSARALHVIKDLGLLSGDFLAVLPNNDDSLPERYKVIRAAVVAEMKAQALVPTFAGRYAPASRLCQARASLKALLSDEDLAFVTGRSDQPTWAITAPQKSQAQDKFLASLGIASWDAASEDGGRLSTCLECDEQGTVAGAEGSIPKKRQPRFALCELPTRLLAA